MASSGDAYVNSSVSEECNYTYTCLPCESDGQKLQAVGYCINCREYLCRKCYDVHLIPSQMKRHVLLDEKNMADADKDDKARQGSTERCNTHREQIIEYHCPTHSFFGCHICFYKHQKDCRDVLYIPEIAQNIASSSEFHDFTSRVTGISSKCTQLISEINRDKSTNNTCHDEAVGGIKDYKKELLDAIDRLENALLDKAKEVRDDGNVNLDARAKKVSAILSESQKIAVKIELLQNKDQSCDLYTAMVGLKDKLLQLEDDLRTVEGDIRTERFEYKSNDELLETLKSPFGLGRLSKTGVITKLEHVKDIDCKTGSDTTTCFITGAVMLPNNKIILTDRSNNNKVKILDTGQQKTVEDMKMSCEPWGVCQITPTQVAVALPSDKKLVFVDVAPSLRINKELSVDGNCSGVDYCEGKLIVSYGGQHKVEIMDLQGTVLTKITTDTAGQNLFNGPYNVVINPYNKLIYVSNSSGHNIVCMKLDGTVVAKYADSELKHPFQVTSDRSGKMYVCGCDSSHNVHQVTEDCKKVKVILTSADGLAYPNAIVYDQTDGKMYIGMYDNNIVKVFQVTYDDVK